MEKRHLNLQQMKQRALSEADEIMLSSLQKHNDQMQWGSFSWILFKKKKSYNVHFRDNSKIFNMN